MLKHTMPSRRSSSRSTPSSISRLPGMQYSVAASRYLMPRAAQ